MSILRPARLRCLLGATAILVAMLPNFAGAIELAGVKLDDTAKVANTELKLNGAGIRTKVIFKVYAAGLYLTEKKATVQEVLDAKGPRRIELIMLREVSSGDFTEAFLHGLNANSDNNEKARFAGQIVKFGNLFADIPSLKKGDIVTVDWLPAVGTQIQLNGKSLSDALPDAGFYNALLKIWLGENPVDSRLKPQLLGNKG